MLAAPSRLAGLLVLPAIACGTAGGFDPEPPTLGNCEYPAHNGAMALGEALPPYAWPSVQTAAGPDGELDLLRAYCDEDANRAWSPFDLLLFVSIPAW